MGHRNEAWMTSHLKERTEEKRGVTVNEVS
jgi:hypothetical protein